MCSQRCPISLAPKTHRLDQPTRDLLQSRRVGPERIENFLEGLELHGDTGRDRGRILGLGFRGLGFGCCGALQTRASLNDILAGRAGDDTFYTHIPSRKEDPNIKIDSFYMKTPFRHDHYKETLSPKSSNQNRGTPFIPEID